MPHSDSVQAEKALSKRVSRPSRSASSRDASGESYLFYEQGGSVLATTWNGTAWSSPLALGSGSYQNVIGQSATRVPGAPLLVFSRQTSANKLVLFAVPTRAAPPDLQGPPVAPGSLGLVPDAFIAPAPVALHALPDTEQQEGYQRDSLLPRHRRKHRPERGHQRRPAERRGRRNRRHRGVLGPSP